jgi:hypothetical protein
MDPAANQDGFQFLWSAYCGRLDIAFKRFGVRFQKDRVPASCGTGLAEGHGGKVYVG